MGMNSKWRRINKNNGSTHLRTNHERQIIFNLIGLKPTGQALNGPAIAYFLPEQPTRSRRRDSGKFDRIGRLVRQIFLRKSTVVYIRLIGASDPGLDSMPICH